MPPLPHQMRSEHCMIRGRGSSDPAPDSVELLVALPPFTVRDIKECISRTWSQTTAGPDGLERIHLIHRQRHEVLHLSFNFLMACGRQPTQWGTNRTTLNKKESKDGRNPPDNHLLPSIAPLLGNSRPETSQGDPIYDATERLHIRSWLLQQCSHPE